MANILGSIQTSGYIQEVTAFDAAITWREYAGYLETKLRKLGHPVDDIANNVLRTYPPVKTKGYE